jgi:2-methylisocitrate lyase-like PEP mutase family enzyme
MVSQRVQATLLNQLHIKGNPLILVNIWDAGSAKAMEAIGTKVIATGSWSVAASHGYDDGEKFPFDLVLANLRRIKESVKIPVTIDIEGGYGNNPAQVKDSVLKIIEHGAAGINIEDQNIAEGGLRPIEDQCLRLAAARDAADQTEIPLFINARTDIFLQNAPDQHNEADLEHAIRRSEAFAEAGASGLFVPGLSDPWLIETLCKRSTLPVNIMVTAITPPPPQLAELGVARISYGPLPFQQVMDRLKEIGAAALS